MLRKTFLRGITTILPIAITFSILIWMLRTIEDIFGFFIQKILGESHYFPGLGILVGLAFVFAVGLAMNAWLGNAIYSLSERCLQKIPLIKTLYSAVRDLMAFFEGKKSAGKRVVAVNLAGGRLMGLITREDFEGLPQGLGDSQHDVVVYIPMSYQVGGFTLVVPKSSVTPLNISVEAAMRYSVTAGMSAEANRS